MSLRRLRAAIAIACAAVVFGAVPATSWGQDPGEGQYTERAPDFEPADPEPQPEPAPAPAPTPTSPPPAAAPAQSVAPTSTTPTPAAEQLPATGADPRLALAALAMLILGFGLRSRTRAI